MEDSFDRGKIGPDNIHYKYVEFYGHVNDPFDLIIIYHSFATLGGEINEGQMLLEVTRVKDKKVLLIGKALAILGMTLLFYVVNVICSSCAYIFFLSKTSNGYSEIFTTHAYNVESSLISLASLLFILFFTYGHILSFGEFKFSHVNTFGDGNVFIVHVIGLCS